MSLVLSLVPQSGSLRPKATGIGGLEGGPLEEEVQCSMLPQEGA